jgi:hypothetical protein
VVEAGSEVEVAGSEEAVVPPLVVLEVLLHWTAMCNDTGHSPHHLRHHCHQHCELGEEQAVKAARHEAHL